MDKRVLSWPKLKGNVDSLLSWIIVKLMKCQTSNFQLKILNHQLFVMIQNQILLLFTFYILSKRHASNKFLRKRNAFLNLLIKKVNSNLVLIKWIWRWSRFAKAQSAKKGNYLDLTLLMIGHHWLCKFLIV